MRDLNAAFIFRHPNTEYDLISGFEIKLMSIFLLLCYLKLGSDSKGKSKAKDEDLHSDNSVRGCCIFQCDSRDTRVRLGRFSCFRKSFLLNIFARIF